MSEHRDALARGEERSTAAAAARERLAILERPRDTGARSEERTRLEADLARARDEIARAEREFEGIIAANGSGA